MLIYDIKFSENSKETFKKVLIGLNLISNDDDLDIIFEFLVQNNNDLYYFVRSSNEIYHNDENIYNYINNYFNKYRKILEILIGLLLNEQNNYKQKITKICIVILIVMFITFIIIYIYISKYLILSKKKFINYIKLLYGINSNLLKIAIQESLNIINYLKGSYENNDFQFDVDNKNIENKLNLNENKKNVNGKFLKNNKINNKEKDDISNNNILFLILFGFLLLIFYCCFILNFIYLLNLFKESNIRAIFSNHFDTFLFQILDMFNIYREYLYDKNFKILNYTALEYLRVLEDEVYDTVTEAQKKVDEYIFKLFETHSDLMEVVSVNFCLLNVTDYFDSLEECSEKFKYLYKYNFNFLANYFLEEIKVGKNIVKYKDKNENIVGNLNNNNITNLIEEYQYEMEKNNNTEFRLNLFNNEMIHSKLNGFFINQILQNIKISREIFFSHLSLDGKESFFIFLHIFYFIILSIVFIVSHISINEILNVQINKAKNLLSIIPISVLTAQNNNNYIRDLFVDK